MRAVLFALPEDVERFEPVLRRCRGAEALLAPGRFLPAVRDSRDLVREALRQRGWMPRERAAREFDRILTTTRVAPSAVAAWLAPGGRTVVWNEAGVRSRWHLGLQTPPRAAAQPEIAAIAAPTDDVLEGVHPEHATAVGDPLLDASFEAGAASRARHALGLRGERPVVLVLLDAIPDPLWAASLAALRSEADLVVLMSDALCLAGDGGSWPRVLTGPGIHLVEALGTCRRADAIAVADLVVGQPGTLLDAAWRRGRRTLTLQERGGAHAPKPRFDGPTVDAPEHVRTAVLDLLVQEIRSVEATSGAAARLAAVLDSRALDLAAL